MLFHFKCLAFPLVKNGYHFQDADRVSQFTSFWKPQFYTRKSQQFHDVNTKFCVKNTFLHTHEILLSTGLEIEWNSFSGRNKLFPTAPRVKQELPLKLVRTSHLKRAIHALTISSQWYSVLTVISWLILFITQVNNKWIKVDFFLKEMPRNSV